MLKYPLYIYYYLPFYTVDNNVGGDWMWVGMTCFVKTKKDFYFGIEFCSDGKKYITNTYGRATLQ